MRISDFFDLSIHEVEEYIKSRTTFECMISSDLAKCLGLTGFNNYVFGLAGKIHVAKKPNPYRIYFAHMIRSRAFEEFWISFDIVPKFTNSFLIGISPETLEITNIVYGGKTHLGLDKTKRLREFLYEHY